MNRPESIYAAAVREVEKKREYQRFLDWGIGQFVRFALPVVIKWEKRKPPEYRAVLRSLELRG